MYFYVSPSASGLQVLLCKVKQYGGLDEMNCEVSFNLRFWEPKGINLDLDVSGIWVPLAKR